MEDDFIKWQTYCRTIDNSNLEELSRLLAVERDISLASSVVARALEHFPAFQRKRLIRMAPEETRDFLEQRASELAILAEAAKASTLLTEALIEQYSNWLQMRLAEQAVARSDIELLAKSGRTRRIRGVASTRSRDGDRSIVMSQDDADGGSAAPTSDN